MTVAELLAIVVVAAILLAIAIPFLVSKKHSDAEVSVKNDLRNAGMMMEQSVLSNKNKFPSYIPNYVQQSEKNQLALDLSKSNEQRFCIVGTHQDYPELRFLYDSGLKSILPTGQECLTPSSGNWAKDMSQKKALIVFATNLEYWKTGLSKAGFGEVAYEYNATADKYKDYDLIVAAGSESSIPYEVLSQIEVGYERGSSVIVEGAGNSVNNLDIVIKKSQFQSFEKGLKFSKSRLPTKPSFPNTFNPESFGNGSQRSCVTELVKDAVPITYLDAKDSPRCVTSAVLSGKDGGVLQYATYLSPETDNQAFLNALVQWGLQ